MVTQQGHDEVVYAGQYQHASATRRSFALSGIAADSAAGTEYEKINQSTRHFSYST
jgi:hypothetical protein